MQTIKRRLMALETATPIRCRDFAAYARSLSDDALEAKIKALSRVVDLDSDPNMKRKIQALFKSFDGPALANAQAMFPAVFR